MWLYWVFMCAFPCVSLWFAILDRCSASCHIATCFFVDVVDFSLVTTLFCFISLDTTLGNFFVIVLSVYVCVFLCLSVICNFWKALSIVSCRNLFFFVVVVHFSLVTTLFCFISLGTLLATFVLSVYGCIYFSVICNFWLAFCILSHCNLFLCWCCWFLTCDNSLCFISLGTLLEASNYSLWLYWVFICVFSCITLCQSWQCFLHHATLQLVSLLLLLLFFLTHGTHQTCGMSSDWSERCWQIYCN